MQRVRTFKIKAIFNVAFLYAINFEGFMMNNMMFDIQGMKTGACINRVYEALDHIDGLTNISVSLWSGQVVMQINPTLVTFSQVSSAVTNLGFKASAEY